MANAERYRREYPLTGDPQESFERIYRYLLGQGFRYVEYQGEQVFKRGKGWLTAPNFVKVTYTADTVRVEAWIKLAVLPGVYVGEYGLTGFVGSAAKGPVKRAVAWLETELGGVAAVPTFEAARIPAAEAAQTMTPAEYRRLYAPERFCKDVKSLCTAAYVLIGISAVGALASNPPALVDSLLMLALVLMIHLRKSKACVTGLMAYSVYNCVAGMIFYGMPTGYLWIILSVALLAHFNQADKLYREAVSAAEAAKNEPDQSKSAPDGGV